MTGWSFKGGTRQLSLPGVSMKKLVYTNLRWYAYSIREKCDQNMFILLKKDEEDKRNFMEMENFTGVLKLELKNPENCL